jgi:hypothetical protein
MKKINVGGTSAKPAKSNGHQRVEAGSVLQQLLTQYATVHPEAKRLTDQDRTLSRQIAAETRPLFWATFAGVAPESSTLVVGVNGDEFKLLVKDHYPETIIGEGQLYAAIGEEKTNANFHWKTNSKIDYDQVPEALQEPLAEHLEAFRAKHNLPVGAIISKQFLAPNVGFHKSRSIILTTEENARLDAIMPCRSNPLL